MHSSDAVDFDAPTATLLSTPGHVIGTMPYMSPEQVQGEQLDAGTDIFSLGVTFYEMLAGKHPFRDKSAAMTMSRIFADDLIATDQFRAQVSPELQALVTKMLCKDKAERYQSARGVLNGLKSAAGQTISRQCADGCHSDEGICSSHSNRTSRRGHSSQSPAQQMGAFRLDTCSCSTSGCSQPLASNRPLRLISSPAIHLCFKQPAADG